jgi:hypothetical protein
VAIAVPHLKPIVAPPRWAKDDLWRKAQLVPSLDLNFAATKNLVDATTGAELVTFTRTSEKTVRGPASPILVPSNLPAFEDDPFTGESLGLLIEEQRVQILELTDTLATQTKTVTAVAHTLSFYGTGTVVLSGAHSAMVVGLGAYPIRTTLTFTPSAGSLTLTVSGSVRFAQLETGSFATSYIPNSGTSQVTRAADVASITGTNFSSWYRQDEGTVFVGATNRETYPGFNIFPYLAQIDDGTNANRVSFDFSVLVSGYRYSLALRNNNVAQFAIGPLGIAQNSAQWAVGLKSGDFASNVSVDPASVFTNTTGTLPNVMTQLIIGTGFPGKQFNGTIRRLTYWPARLPDSTLQTITQ